MTAKNMIDKIDYANVLIYIYMDRWGIVSWHKWFSISWLPSLSSFLSLSPPFSLLFLLLLWEASETGPHSHLFIYFYLCLCVSPECLSVHAVHTWYSWKSEESIRPLVTRVEDGCEAQCRCWEFEPGFSARTVGALNHGAISPTSSAPLCNQGGTHLL